MLPIVEDIVATQCTRLPVALHHAGEPNEWVRTTRPGRRLHSFLEGPCFDGDGVLWLADVPYGRLFRVSRDGAWELAHQYDGEPHGLALRSDGTFAIADYRHGLLSFDPATRSIETLCSQVNTERFRGLGDVKIGPAGDIWFTDPGRSSLSDPTGRLFRLRPGSARPEMVLGNVPYPNGVALSPDGGFVYVAATRSNAVWRLLADAPDPVFAMAGTFVNLSGGLGPDGLAVDRQGNLAVAQAQAGRVYVFNASGDPITRIHLPEGKWTTSVAFSPDGRSLHVVEAEHGAIWTVELNSNQEGALLWIG